MIRRSVTYKQHDAASLGDEAMGNVSKRLAGGADAMYHQHLAAVLRAKLIDSYRAVLPACQYALKRMRSEGVIPEFVHLVLQRSSLACILTSLSRSGSASGWRS